MACAGHCLRAAAIVARLPTQFATNAPRCHALSCAQLLHPLQLTAATSTFGAVWKSRGGASLTNRRQIISMATQDAGTSTLVVQEVEFVWKGPASKVLLSGDFVSWDSQLELEKTGTEGWFVIKQKLAPGTYKYKYIVDGEWKHSPDSPTISDGAGGFNNEITVAEDKASTQSTNGEGATQAEGATPAPKEAEPKPSAKSSAAAEAKPAAAAEAKPAAAAEAKPAAAAEAKPAAAAEAKPAAAAEAKPAAAASPPKPKAAAAKKAAKAPAKPLPELMAEDVIPKLTAHFSEKEKGISDVEIKFDDNQLQGGFIKNNVAYNFWAYFPDGKLDGSRGFSLTSHGSPPSTIEPFLIDESKNLSGDAVVQQVIKRLFAQKLLATN